MDWVRIVFARVRGLFAGRRTDSDLGDEFDAHLEMSVEENLRRGMSEEDARNAARREFGGVEQIKEIYREGRGLPMVEAFLNDLRFGARMLQRNPGFAAVAILTLALGIGATVSIFSVVNALLLRPLPFPDSDRLVILQESIPKVVQGKFPVSALDILDFQHLSHSLESLAAFSFKPMDLSGNGFAEGVDAARASAALFRILGVQPVLGRTFTDGEDKTGNNVAILGYSLWQTRYGGDPKIVGKKILLDREPYFVIGVMPAGFEFPSKGLPYSRPAQIWVPIAFSSAELDPSDRGNNFNFGVLAKVKPRISGEAANADVMTVAKQIQEQFYPVEFRDRSKVALEASVTPLADLIVGKTKRMLFLLLGAVGLLLLIACANVANLVLSRGAARQKEIAVRVALGAGRLRLVRQLLVESSLLGLAGGALGLFAGYSGLKGLVAIAAAVLPRAKEVSLDTTVFCFTLGISILSGILFGIVPAFAAARADLNETLKESGRSDAGSRGHRRIRDSFVVAQMALAVLLVTGSGLLIRSFVRARETNPGFTTEKTIGLMVALPNSQYKKAQQEYAFFERLLADTKAAPSVVSVGFSSDPPMNSNWKHTFVAEGHEADQNKSAPYDYHTLVDGDYFRTLGIPLVRGRFFNEEESLGKNNVVIISDGMARRYWPSEDPVGRHLKWPDPTGQDPWLTIVGVVGDVKQGALDDSTEPHTYEPFRQVCDDEHLGPLCRTRTMLIRSGNPPNVLVKDIRNLVQQIDPQQPIGKVFILEQVVAASLAPRRFNTWLLTVFGFGAMLLAAIGVYGVISGGVTQQTRELGVRIALGAKPGDVLRLVLWRGLKLALVGLSIGLAASLAATRLMAGLLYDVSVTDPLTFTVVGALLIVVALVACWIPARRAMRVDPMIALRYE
jgi:predicted permease